MKGGTAKDLSINYHMLIDNVDIILKIKHNKMIVIQNVIFHAFLLISLLLVIVLYILVIIMIYFYNRSSLHYFYFQRCFNNQYKHSNMRSGLKISNDLNLMIHLHGII